MDIINTYALQKKFGETVATNQISINVKQGEIYGFLGLNGAGKSTLIRMLLGMIRPDNGSIKLFGENLNNKFNKWNDVGYMVETPYSYPNLTVIDNLKVFYTLRKLKQPELIDEIIDNLKLTRYKNKKARNLSLGNQQRLGLAKALMHKPKLLILDEPINGLDPEGIVEVRELLSHLAQQGSTIFLSSHILGEISKIANRVAIIHEGKLIKEISSHELNNQLIKKLLINTPDNIAAVSCLKDMGYAPHINSMNEIEISDIEAIKNPEKISVRLVEKNFPPKQIYQFTEDLEMFFLRTIK